MEEIKELLLGLGMFLDTCGFNDAYFYRCKSEGETPDEFNKAFVESGFGLLGIPKEYGGRDATYRELALVSMLMGEKGFPQRHIMNILQAKDMIEFGSEKQKEMVFSHIKETGSGCFCFGISERDIKTTAKREDGKVILNGHKAYVSNGLVFPYILVLAMEEDIEGNPQSMFFVPRDAEGLKFNPMGKKGLDCEIYFENVTLPEDSLVGEVGMGLDQFRKHIEMERFSLSVMATGMVKCAYLDAARHIKLMTERRPDGDFQMDFLKISDIFITLRNMESMVLEIADKKDRNLNCRKEIAMTKYYCGKEGFKAVDGALQILGASGFRPDNRVYGIFKELRGLRLGGGSDEMMAQVLAKQLIRNV